MSHTTDLDVPVARGGLPSLPVRVIAAGRVFDLAVTCPPAPGDWLSIRGGRYVTARVEAARTLDGRLLVHATLSAAQGR